MTFAPLIALTLALTTSSSVKVVGYVETIYGDAKPSDLDFKVCTHVIEAFIIPEISGKIRAANQLPRQDLIKAARAVGSKVLVAVGGATVPGSTFSSITSNQIARHRFISELVQFVVKNGYDGVDIDWEFPSPNERERYLKLVRDIRIKLQAAFNSKHRKNSLIFVGVTPGAHLEGYDFAGLAKEVDAFIQFGYDFRNPALGPWAHTSKLWPDGADKSIEASVRGTANQLIRRGVPREKLIIGLPFYTSDGRPWIDIRERVLSAPLSLHPLFLENQWNGIWVTGPRALEAKVQKILYGKEIAGGSASGVAFWQLGHQGRFRDLTEALRRALKAKKPHLRQ